MSLMHITFRHKTFVSTFTFMIFVTFMSYWACPSCLTSSLEMDIFIQRGRQTCNHKPGYNRWENKPKLDKQKILPNSQHRCKLYSKFTCTDFSNQNSCLSLILQQTSRSISSSFETLLTTLVITL